MKRLSLTVFLGLLMFSMSYAQELNIEFEEYDLANGLHVILHEDHSVPIVATTVLYHVGSKDEDPDKTGFAHFFEHLMFEGSENIKRGDFDDYLEKAGGTNNANTSQDRTFYYEIVPSNQLELTLWMESERMLHAKIDSVGIETQREVVKEEKRQRYDNQPYGTWILNLFDRAYTESSYNWSPIGSLEHLNAAKREDFMAFYNKFYVPNNAVLSIAGDIDMAQTKEWVEAYFGPIPKGNEVERNYITEPKQTAEVRDTVYDNIQLPAVFHAYKTPAMGTQESYAVDMLMQLLSQGESSRLNKSVRDKQQKAIQVAAFPFSLENDPSISVTLGLANFGVEPADLEEAMEAEYEKVKDELISENEFQKLRNQIENDFFSSNSSMSGIAESLADYYAYYDKNTNLINTEIEKYLSVTREDIQKMAQKYLVKENRVTLYYLPKPQEEKEQ
ncbi:MAG: pitrilysin family protein [Bacteroidota bacterium]